MTGLGLIKLRQASKKLPPRQWLVDGVIERGSFVGIIGAAEAGKTFVAIDLAAAVASGTTWLGMNVSKQGTVAYVSAEATSSVVRRLIAWQKYHDTDISDCVHVPSVPATITNDTDSVMEDLCEVKPDLIIIDTWARATPGMSENSADSVSEVVHFLDNLRHNTGAAVVVIHHVTSSTGQARGSSALRGAFDVEFTVGSDEPGTGFLYQTKVKDGERNPNNTLDFIIVTGYTDDEGNAVGVIKAGAL